MSENNFKIEILSLEWSPRTDGQNDLCAHGSIDIQIGEKSMVSEMDCNNWSLSTAALYLMRTLEADHEPCDFGNYLIPCCGFLWIPNDTDDHLMITKP